MPRNSVNFESFKRALYDQDVSGFQIPQTIKNIYNTEK